MIQQISDDALPQPIPELPPPPEPKDVDYCGRLRLEVDARDVVRRIFQARVTIPVAGGGPLILMYPKWLPGFHSPQAPIELMAGLNLTANGETLRWVRHPVAVNAFRVDVPHGATEIEASFQFLSPTEASHGRVIVTEDMLMLPWNTVALYPGGHFARRIELQAIVTLPEGWEFATALDVAEQAGNVVTFEPVALDRLVDSPLLAARHLKRISLDDAGEVTMNVAADRAEQLEMTPEQIAPHRAVVEQCDKLFGARHFRRYELLLCLSQEMTAAGIEHHQSCEIGSKATYFTEWEKNFTERDTIAHEFIHSWNGKHRRGKDSWSPCFEKPIRNSLMWVYEGLTQYWCQVLAARTGLWNVEQTLGALAQTAATYDLRPGSRWRPLIDTTRDPIIAARNPLPWTSWQRSEDYYSEGTLVWLDVDTRLRELTNEARSLDDFARAFFGPDDQKSVTHTYDFEDVVQTLGRIAPHDWQGLFEHLLTETRRSAPLEGLERGGYRLVFKPEPNVYTQANETTSGTTDLSFSIGLSLSAEGQVSDVVWDGPAFQAGLSSGVSIVGVNERTFEMQVLKDAIAATAEGEPLRLTIKKAQRVREVAIDYDGGLRFPHLERIADANARLDEILKAR